MFTFFLSRSIFVIYIYSCSLSVLSLTCDSRKWWPLSCLGWLRINYIFGSVILCCHLKETLSIIFITHFYFIEQLWKIVFIQILFSFFIPCTAFCSNIFLTSNSRWIICDNPSPDSLSFDSAYRSLLKLLNSLWILSLFNPSCFSKVYLKLVKHLFHGRNSIIYFVFFPR